MKILVLSHMYPNNINKSYGIFVHEQVKELKKLGHEVKVISPVPYAPPVIRKFKEKWKKYSLVNRYEKIEGIDVYYPRMITIPRNIMIEKSGSVYFYSIKKLVEEIKKSFEFDLIHAHVALPDGYAANVIGKKYNKPVILTIHGKDIYGTVNLNEKAQNSVKAALNKCDRLVVVSDKLKELTSKYTNKNINVIENGVDLKKVDGIKDIEILNKKYDGKIKVLSVGYLIERKGHRYVIEALKNLVDQYNNIIYLIVGEGEKYQELKELSKKYNLEGHIDFIGALTHDDVMRYMNICDVFILPSWNEAFGVVYAEAMASYKPVIGCKNEGIDGIIKDKKNGVLVESKSSKEIYNALKYLIENPYEREIIGKLARNTIEKFTWESNALKNIDLYKNAIAKYKDGDEHNGR
ncbi:glycosyltransferase [Paraclostridium sp. AKS81]|uniref:glycosyltransferase n=1 Tax=Paraclostridium sp. AKS81 TaxID=2876117 RepID=UPI0021DFA3A7|nr:glycosyltransferase [Paraclostridium sp. AKS81]MCU9810320.1 glycosyltransferase [Paraclostridium sp. AKS81]